MSRRNEPIFWLDNKCPFCGHSAPVIYKPDLLKGPIAFKCQSVTNPLRKNSPCFGEWDVVIDIDRKQELLALLDLADKYDYYIKQTNKIICVLYKRDGEYAL